MNPRHFYRLTAGGAGLHRIPAVIVPVRPRASVKYNEALLVACN